MSPISLKVIDFRKGESIIKVLAVVDECPVCRKGIEPFLVSSRIKVDGGNNAWIMYQCPLLTCQSVFVVKYYRSSGKGSVYFPDATYPASRPVREFSKVISNISPEFVDIYNQALHADDLGLKKICGMGYRKALEFLVKDWCVFKNPTSAEVIRSMQLVPCIKKFIDNVRIKDCAERGAWLGNDETHYIRKWEQHDIEDLKALIDLTLHFVESESLYEQYMNEMPIGRAPV
jgi:hypothetical protein